VLTAGFVRARVWGLCLFTAGFVAVDFVLSGFGGGLGKLHSAEV